MRLSQLSTLLFLAAPLPGLAVPTASQAVARADAAAGGFWIGAIQRQGAPAFGDAGFKVFRNVKDYGAKGDGSTDDTEAINRAVSDGNRCTQGCDSSTTTPALVYFPAGTYLVTKPIVQLYYTQFVGDATNPPTLKAAASFTGMAVIDSDPYDNQGNNFWVNQNNFFRQVRNFVIDIKSMPVSAGACIHWQVAQATSLHNIVFNMRDDGGEANVQQGIFMDNGSGGFMSDLTFNGGKYGAFFGNQQYTTRNLTFNGCKTAILMNWNWLWTLQDVKISNCGVGIDMAAGQAAQSVGSVLLVDSVISNTPIGISTTYDPNSAETNGTLILDNVDMSQGVGVAISNPITKQAILPGGRVPSFSQGRAVAGGSNGAGAVSRAAQAAAGAVTKPEALLDPATGKVFTRAKPQYENFAASQFISVKSAGAKGDGKTDDSDAIQKVLDSVAGDANKVVFFDHGAYLVTKTIKVPKDIKMTGEVWSTILAGGSTTWTDQANLKPVLQVGQPGDVGSVEMSDLLVSTAGPQPGAVMIEWNVAGSAPGAAGMWDVHVRIGGAAGTQLELEQCAKNPNATNAVKSTCFGAGLMFHATPQSSAYLENTWFWVADHSLEPAAKSQQIDIFSGRGVLIETNKAFWGWGTASEHSVLYNYQLRNASAVYLASIQTETPYYQGNPIATTPFNTNAALSDPDFAATCKNAPGPACARSWGLRVIDSRDVFVYGAGLYSFFDNYGQVCVNKQNCQDNIVSIENSKVHLAGLSTKASVNMLTVNGASVAVDSDFRNNFCATLALFQSQ